jgi:hypothetical protein
MSHVVSIKTELRDIEAVKRACAELGLEFKENQKTIKWFGAIIKGMEYRGADAASNAGIAEENYGKCDHAIGVPGSKYEIGLVKNPATGGYKVYYDYWDDGSGTCGKAIQDKLGQGCEKLIESYSTHKCTILLENLRKQYPAMNIKRTMNAAGEYVVAGTY